jgi:hypothetical protein
LAVAGETVSGVTNVTLTVFEKSVPGFDTLNGTIPAEP